MATTMRTWTDENAARAHMRAANGARVAHGPRGTDLIVLVDGPNDGEWTTMPLKTAIENDFSYTWEAPARRREVIA